MRQAEFRLLLGALLAISASLGLTSSLWLDEAGTWWIIRDGLGDAISRALSWSATSPFYYSLAWVAVQGLGLSEVALRVPSLLFTLGTVVAFYRLGLRWLDPKGAATGVLFLFCLSSVRFTVIDARPYALGLMLLICTWLAMLRWLETGYWREGIVLIVCAAATVWTHYTFAMGLLPLAWYSPRLGLRRSSLTVVGVSLLLLPLAVQIADTLERREVLSWSQSPTILQLGLGLGLLFPLPLFVLRAAVNRVGSGEKSVSYESREKRASIIPLMLLVLLPPLLFYAFSRIGVVQLFAPRYLLCKSVGMALLGAWAVRGTIHPKVQKYAVVAVVVLALAWNVPHEGTHGGEDWRASSEWVRTEVETRPETRVVLISGFVESLQPGRLDNPGDRDVLFAPQTVYPVPGESIPLPWKLNDDAELRLKAQVVPAAKEAGRIAVVSRPLEQSYEEVLVSSLRATGLDVVEKRRFGSVVGLLFESRKVELESAELLSATSSMQ